MQKAKVANRRPDFRHMPQTKARKKMAWQLVSACIREVICLYTGCFAKLAHQKVPKPTKQFFLSRLGQKALNQLKPDRFGSVHYGFFYPCHPIYWSVAFLPASEHLPRRLLSQNFHF